MKSKKGFTLIELLAVIVILGLLMAIAIPSVTKYITQSRKKTLTTTIGNYMSALTTQVNDMEYIFTDSNTVYAVPIECIALERGGTNPFGKWHQASNAYWSYVLVQYDDTTSSYTYGFTFKDSAGYGLYPTTSEKLNEDGSQIQTGLSLTRPKTGIISNITIKDNWLGFNVDSNTNLIVLDSTSEGEIGDGKFSCTLSQKGDNYEAYEQEKSERYAIGKEVCIGSECFNIVSNNGLTITLLAKEKIDLSTNKPKQNSNAGESIFSNGPYWCSYSEIKPGYGTSYPTFVYDSNTVIYQYVEAYEKYLKEDLGLSSASASLISHNQLINDLGCVDSGCESSSYISWIKKSYNWWTGSATFCDHLIYVNNAGHTYYYWSGVEIGIRPVITVSKSDLNI